jgi:hypothetical protein
LHRYNALKAYRRYGGECPYTLFLDEECKCAMGHKLRSVVSTIKHPSIYLIHTVEHAADGLRPDSRFGYVYGPFTAKENYPFHVSLHESMSS